MKTAMQELIEFVNTRCLNGDFVLEKAHELLEKEKEQIIHAFNCGESFSVDYFNAETPKVAPSVNYYLQYYQNK